jgi:hypothetical protein
VAAPRTRNGIRHASSAAKTLEPSSIRFGVKTTAIVMPIDSPVITKPMPRLRFSCGVSWAISERSLE